MLEKVTVRFLERPKTKVPVLVCGMPDTGYVGRLAPDYLRSALKAKLVADFYSEYFPAQIRINKEGVADLLKGQLFWSRGDGKNMLIFTGDAQPATPEGQHVISEKILAVAQELGVKRVFTLGAFITGMPVAIPRVFGTATSSELLKTLEAKGVKTMTEGNITGMNGLLFGLAQIKGMQGIGLYGETSGFAVDTEAAKAIVVALADILDLSLDYSSLKLEEQPRIEEEEPARPETKEESQKKVREYIT